MSKQSKQYESMRQTQANTFSDGLNMDLHPLTTPNTILTDCVNGTMITYNDNEFVLQNERGNSKIKIGDTEHVKLSEGFIPVGMKEHNGILYIVSHNPQTKQSEIGTFPSPANITNFIDNNFEKTVEIEGKTIIYSEFESEINYYDPDLIVSNFDKYQLNQVNTDNPLLVLEHFILNKNGEMQKLDLKDDNTTHRFNHIGEGLLGYKYRPFSIDAFNAYITPIQNANNAKLFVDFTTTDNELINNYKNIGIRCDVHVFLGDKQFARKPSIIFKNFTEYHNLQGNGYLTLDFTNDISTVYCSYDQKKGVIIYNGIEYSDLKFVVELSLFKDGYNLFMDHLTKTIEIKASEVIQPLQTFSVFKYKKNESDKLDILIKLDMAKYSPNHTINSIYDIGEASYKLLKIDKNGNLEGKIVANSKFFLGGQISYPIVASAAEVNNYELTLVKNEEDDNAHYCFKPSTMIEKSTELPAISISSDNPDIMACNNIYEVENATKVKYLKVNGQYNIILLNDKDEVVSTTIYDQCESGADMVDERWEDPNTLEYEINDVEYDPNSVYLLQLTYPINNDNNIASFIVVTTDKMLTDEHYELDRMDLLGIEDWYDPNITISHIKNESTHLTSNNSIYIQNKLPIEDILKCESEEDVEILAKRVFLKYNQLLETNKIIDEIPSISLNQNYKTVIQNTNTYFDVYLDVLDQSMNINEAILEDILYNKVSLNKINEMETTQTSERKYLYDIFKDDWREIDSIKAGTPYTSGWQYGGFGGIRDCIGLNHPYGIYYTRHHDAESLIKNEILDWISTTGTIKKDKWYLRKRTGGCSNTAAIDKKEYNSINKTDGIYGVTLQLMKLLNMNNSMCYGKIKNEKYVKYSGDSTQIWIHGKKPEISNYVLVGMNLWSSGDSKIAWEILKKHLYYLEFSNKRVVQYTYDGIIETNKNSVQYKYRSFPSQCLAIHNNYNYYNVQSWDNLNYNILNYIDIISNAVEFDSISENCKSFLTYLGNLINTYPISETVLKEENASTDHPDLLHDDFSEQLLTSDFNWNTLKIPSIELYYDQNRNHIYIITNTEDKNGFEYISSECMYPLYWNYSIDFCWDAEYSTVQPLDKYHSLQFYKLTSYEPE